MWDGKRFERKVGYIVCDFEVSVKRVDFFFKGFWKLLIGLK